MKRMLLVAMLAIAGLSHANAAEPTSAVVPQMSASQSCGAISISTSAATSVVDGTKYKYRDVAVQNIDSTYALNCSDSVSVSTTSTSALYGLVVPAGSPGGLAVFYLVPGQDWYCKSQSVTAATRAVVCKGR